MGFYCVSEIGRVEYWDCGIQSHRHRTKKTAISCFVGGIKRSHTAEISSIDMTISALTGYTYEEVCIKHRRPGADVKYHIEKVIKRMIEMGRINYNMDCVICPLNCTHYIKTIHELREDREILLPALTEYKKSLLDEIESRTKIS